MQYHDSSFDLYLVDKVHAAEVSIGPTFLFDCNVVVCNVLKANFGDFGVRSD